MINKNTAFLAALSIVGCTTLAPQAELVSVTREPADVKNCKALGQVWSHPPYVLPTDWRKQMQNETAAKNGDTVLVTQNPYLSVVAIPGIAYACKQTK